MVNTINIRKLFVKILDSMNPRFVSPLHLHYQYSIKVTFGNYTYTCLLINPTAQQVEALYKDITLVKDLNMSHVKGENSLVEANVDLRWYRVDDFENWLDENGYEYIRRK